MISPQQEEVLWVFDFVGQEETDGLQGLLPPVHVVPQEQVVALWREASIFKQPQQVVVLAVDVSCRGQGQVSARPQGYILKQRLTTDLEGSLQLQQNGLAEEDFPGFQTQSADFVFLELDVLAGFCSSD